MKKSQIICTIGPASSRKETIVKMAKAGMAIARINFSHGNHEQHQKLIDAVRAANKRLKANIKILQDLEGYRIRIGQMKRSLLLIKHQQLFLTGESHEREDHIPIETDADLSRIKRGMNIFVADGMIQLRVLGREGKKIRVNVEHGEVLSSRKGVNIPALKLESNILTDKDKRDIEFGIQNKVDYVAQSFVRTKKDVLSVSKLVKEKLPDCKILAKIENNQGVRNIDSIISACDGILIARGDLGVSLPIYKIPCIQKDIIKRCKKRKKIAITATQMLESMIEYPRPTRAEVSDVANAVIDGTDYVMLSGETAVGNYPVKCVRMMFQIINHTVRNC